MTQSWWQIEEHVGERRKADVLVVGAGLAGASVAYWLGRAGVGVAVADAGAIANGASGRNAGFLTGGSLAQFGRWVKAYGEQTAWELIEGTRENRNLLVEHVLSEEPSCRFSQPGSVTVALDEAEASAHHGIAETLLARGLPLERVGDAELRAWGMRGFHSGWWFSEDARMQPVFAARAILARSGAHVWPNTAVLRVTARAQGVEVFTSRGRIHCGSVVFATNGMGGGLHPWLDAHIVPTRGQALVTHRLVQREALDSPSVYAVGKMAYWRPTASGRLVVGGCRSFDESAEQTGHEALNPVVHAALDRVLAEHLPGANAAGVDMRWAGIMGYTRDALPLCGPVPGTPHAFVSAGFCGHGTGWTFRLGRLLAEHMQHGAPLGPTDSRRFDG